MINTLALSAENPADTTHKINQAIAKASEAGGGRVVLPPGHFLVGSIFLKSHVTLEIPAGTTLQASPDVDLYPPLPVDSGLPPHLRKAGQEARRHFIVVQDTENATICGRGIIDGNVAAFTPGWETKKPFTWTGAGKRIFQPTVELLRSRNVRLRDVTIQNSPGWTCHVCLCDDVRITDVTLLNYLYAGGSDGFDVDGSRDVWFTGCRIETGDDCIVLKNFPDTRSTERVFISQCNLKTMCAGVKLGTESWHDFRNIHFTDSIVRNSSRAFQITCLDGGTVEDVLVDGILADTNCGNYFNRPIHLDLAQRRMTWHRGKENQPPVGRIRRVSISNMDLKTDGRVLLTAGDGARLEDISLRDIRITMPWIEDPALIGKADPLQGSIACPEAREARAAVVAQNIDRLTVRGVTVNWPGDEPPADDFQPKYAQGELLRDPREDYSPMPPMSVFQGFDLQDEIVQVYGADFPGKD